MGSRMNDLLRFSTKLGLQGAKAEWLKLKTDQVGHQGSGVVKRICSMYVSDSGRRFECKEDSRTTICICVYVLKLSKVVPVSNMSHAGGNDPSDLLDLLLRHTTPMSLPTPSRTHSILRRDILNMLALDQSGREVTLRQALPARSGQGLERDLELAETRVECRGHDSHAGECAVQRRYGVAGDEEGEDRDVRFWG